MGLSAPVKEHDPAYVYAQENWKPLNQNIHA